MSERTARVSREESCVETSSSTVPTGAEVCQVNESVEALKGPQQAGPQFAIDLSLSKGGLLPKGDDLRSLFACGTIGAALMVPQAKREKNITFW